MNIILKRIDFLSSGIFGQIESEDQGLLLVSLEHAYPVIPDASSVETTYAPKIPSGSYTCVRGQHKLEGMTEAFETFEITGVEGHTNLLFHSGNWNKDSSGCVLLGTERDGNNGILYSRLGFEAFMNVQDGIDSFTLQVL